MWIAELAKKGGLVAAATIATAGLVVWTWPKSPEPANTPLLIEQARCLRGIPDVVRPPVVTDLGRFLSHLPVRRDKVDVAFPRATIETNKGTLHCALFPEIAPLAVANFVGLATAQKPWMDPATGTMRKSAFYDGLTFHRVIPGFVIQGGDPIGTGTGGPGYEFRDELSADLRVEPGMLAMANKGPNTNGSQFFITDGSPEWLRGRYTVFGMCEEPEVVHAIAGVARNASDRPVEPVIIEHVSVTQY